MPARSLQRPNLRFPASRARSGTAGFAPRPPAIRSLQRLGHGVEEARDQTACGPCKAGHVKRQQQPRQRLKRELEARPEQQPSGVPVDRRNRAADQRGEAHAEARPVEGVEEIRYPEDGKVELDGERYDDGKGLMGSTYAYAYALNSDLAAGTFSPLVTFKANDVALTITGKTAEVFAGDEFGPYEISEGEIVVNTGADVKLNVSVKSFKLTGGDFNGLTNDDFKIERNGDKDQLQFTLTAPKDIEKTKVHEDDYEMILVIEDIEVVVDVTFADRVETADEMMAATMEALSAGVTVDGKETPDATLDGAKTGMSTAIGAVVTEVNKATVDTSAAGFTSGYKYGSDFVKATNGTKASPAGTNGSCTVTVALTATAGTNTVTEEVDVTVTLAALTYAETDAGMTEAVATAKNALQTAITAATGASATEVKANIEALVANTLGSDAVVDVEVGTPSANSNDSSKWDVTLTITHKDKSSITSTLTLTGI